MNCQRVASGSRRNLSFAVAAVFLLVTAARPPAASAAQAAPNTPPANPWLGRWSINVNRSKYGGPAPKALTHTFEETPGGMKLIVDQITGDGRKIHTEVMVKFDGTDQPVYGDAQRDSTRAFRRIDARTMEVTNKTDGRVTSTVTEVVSADGRTRTTTIVGRNSQQQMRNVLVFDRQ
jgi:hypothetical protein